MERTSYSESLIWCVAAGCKTGTHQNVEDDERHVTMWINYSQFSTH